MRVVPVADSPRKRTKPPLYRRLPRAVREEQILREAGRVFAARGYQAASMTEIADAVGVAKPLLYRYFGSKESLYLTYVRAAGRSLLESIRLAADPALPPDQRLWCGICAFFTFVDERREGWAVLYREAATQGGPFAAELAGLRDGIMTIVSRVLEQAAPASREAGDVAHFEPLSEALVGAGESLANWWLRHPEQSKELMAMRLMNFLWMGLGDLAAGRVWRPADDTHEPVRA